MSFESIPYAILSGQKILIYNQFTGYIDRNHKNENSLKNLENNKTKGILSYNSKKKIRNIVSLWVQSIDIKKKVSRKNNDWKKQQITFTTLTLSSSQQHTDKEIKRNMLNNFLIEIQRKSNCCNYLWCAEKQMNGNIHFHILTNSFIEWQEIRRIWNECQERNNYIENYRQNQLHFHKDGFKVREHLLEKWNHQRQLEAYNYGVKTNWSNPNSTDIHKLEKIDDIAAYVTKYLTKSIDDEMKELYKVWRDAELTQKEMDIEKWNVINDKYKHLLIDGKIWSCSKSLQKLVKYSTTVDSQIEDLIYATINRDSSNKWENERCTVIKNINLNEVKNKSPVHYNEYIKINIQNYNTIYNN